jgi:hypothetical protein
MHKRLLLSLLSLAASGCVTAKATEYSVPKERASECRQICTDLDMRLSAVVVILSKAGCVCEPREAEGTPPRASGASTAAGGAAIQAIADAAQQQQQHAPR